ATASVICRTNDRARMSPLRAFHAGKPFLSRVNDRVASHEKRQNAEARFGTATLVRRAIRLAHHLVPDGRQTVKEDNRLDDGQQKGGLLIPSLRVGLCLPKVKVLPPFLALLDLGEEERLFFPAQQEAQPPRTRFGVFLLLGGKLNLGQRPTPNLPAANDPQR